MALTRSYLRSLGLEDEKITSIIEAHSETVTGLNGKYAELEARYKDLEGRYQTAKADADRLPGVQKKLDETVTGLNGKYAELEKKFGELNELYGTAKADAEKLPGIQKELEELRKDDYKGRYEALSASVEKSRARAAKEAAVKAYYEGKNIKGGNLTIAMRGTDLEQITLDESGKLADTGALDELVSGDFKPLVSGARRTVSSSGALDGKNDPPKSSSDIMNSLLRGE